MHLTQPHVPVCPTALPPEIGGSLPQLLAGLVRLLLDLKAQQDDAEAAAQEEEEEEEAEEVCVCVCLQQ